MRRKSSAVGRRHPFKSRTSSASYYRMSPRQSRLASARIPVRKVAPLREVTHVTGLRSERINIVTSALRSRAGLYAPQFLSGAT